MHELVQQARENDNITTIYVVDDMKHFCGAIDLNFLGMGVSTVVGAFEGVVAVLPVVICFQSLILVI